MPRWLPTKSVLGMAAVAIAVALQACASSDPGPSASPAGSPASNEDPSNTGSVSFDLHVGGKISFSTVRYRIKRAAAYDRSGTFDVSNSATLSGTIPGIPAATGYTMTLTLSASVPNRLISCAGSSPFDIAAGAVTPVPVNVECHETPAQVPIPWGATPILAFLLGVAGVSALRRRAPSDARAASPR